MYDVHRTTSPSIEVDVTVKECDNCFEVSILFFFFLSSSSGWITMQNLSLRVNVSFFIFFDSNEMFFFGATDIGESNRRKWCCLLYIFGVVVLTCHKIDEINFNFYARPYIFRFSVLSMSMSKSNISLGLLCFIGFFCFYSKEFHPTKIIIIVGSEYCPQ